MAFKILPDGKTLTLGMKLVDIPHEYGECINNLFNGKEAVSRKNIDIC
jgi:hypothetical protein